MRLEEPYAKAGRDLNKARADQREAERTFDRLGAEIIRLGKLEDAAKAAYDELLKESDEETR